MKSVPDEPSILTEIEFNLTATMERVSQKLTSLEREGRWGVGYVPADLTRILREELQAITSPFADDFETIETTNEMVRDAAKHFDQHLGMRVKNAILLLVGESLLYAQQRHVAIHRPDLAVAALPSSEDLQRLASASEKSYQKAAALNLRKQGRKRGKKIIEALSRPERAEAEIQRLREERDRLGDTTSTQYKSLSQRIYRAKKILDKN